MPMTKVDMNTTTYHGRSLEELLPKIKAELGPDAIVLRRREGLTGGVGGFFQRSYIEVEARRALEDEQRPAAPDGDGRDAVDDPHLEARNDRATAEGLASPAIRALVEQATPFADALARAQAPAAGTGEIMQAAARGDAGTAGLYGPQPNAAAIAAAAPAPSSTPEPEPEPNAPSYDHVPAARKAEQRLLASGLSAALAEDVVGEAVSHGLPFAPPRSLKNLIRGVLARRMPVLADLGPGPRTIALVGAGGSGKSAAAEHLARAYAEVDAEVVVVALRALDGGCALAARLEPLGVGVIAASDAEQAVRRLARREAALTIIDTPAAGAGDRAAVPGLAADLRALGVDEIHLCLPATVSAAAADEVAAALAPLGLTHVVLTHADQTTRPGAPVEHAVSARRALSYLCTGEAIEPVDPHALARRLLP